MRPVIGISGYIEPARYLGWDHTVSLVPHDYVDNVVRAGGQPIVLPPAGDPRDVIGRLDGLILSGGGDVDPDRYGSASRHERTVRVQDFRDQAELDLVNAALDDGLPFLGICRGLQVLNVARGGSLHQHLPDVVGNTAHAPAPGVFGRLDVRLAPGSRIAQITGNGALNPSHYHHQAIDRLGDGLAVSAQADDGTIEAIELDDHPFAIGVQWHPEVDTDGTLFTALVQAATPLPA